MFGSKNKFSLEGVSQYLLFAVIALSPLFFIPSGFYSIDLAKNSLIIIGLVVVAVLQLLTLFKQKKIESLPKTFLIPLALLGISVIASALYSPTVIKSLFGQGFEINTASFLLALLLAICVTYRSVVSDSKKSFAIYTIVFGSYLILFGYHLLRIIFGADFLDFGIFSTIVSTPVGSWIDFGIFSALIMIMGIMTLKFLNLPRGIKIGVQMVTFLSVIPVILVNARSIWIALSIIFAGLSVYLYKSDKTKKPWLFALIFILILAFASQGYRVVEKINTNLGTTSSDISLTWRSTLDVVVGSVKASPVFGIGENRFTQAYTTFKPVGINETNLWSVEFYRGFGWLGTFTATQGFLGLIAWICLFVVLFRSGKKALDLTIVDPINKYIVISSYFSASFLWILFIVYTPSQAILLLASVFTGIFIASIVNAKLYEAKIFDFQNSKKIGSLVFVVAIAVLILWGVFGVRKIVGMSYFGAGVKHMTVENSLVEAEQSFTKALETDSSNIYWQARAEVAMAMIRNLVSSITAETSASTSEAIAKEAGNLANTALLFSEKAIELDPYNYYNYVSKARVAELAALLTMDKAKEVTIDSYKQAIALNNTNPEIYLSFSRFLASQKMYDEALEVVGASLQVKSNYIDAIYLLSQIQAEKGDLKNATISAKVATEINPNEPLLFFQLGLLEYNNLAYSNAAAAFEKAVSLSGDYANAIYFLGLSYARVGKSSDAIEQFEKLSISNPENQEVIQILSGLRAGKNIFKAEEVQNVTKSKKLPIEQE